MIIIIMMIIMITIIIIMIIIIIKMIIMIKVPMILFLCLYPSLILSTHLRHLLCPRIHFAAYVSKHIESFLDGRWTLSQFREAMEDAFSFASESSEKKRK